MSAARALAVQVRWMIPRDFEQVLTIERECFEFSWNEADLIHVLRNRRVVGRVAEVDDRVVGFMIYELLQTSIDLLDVAVIERHQRHGVGATMIDELRRKLTPRRRSELTAVVSERNLIAQLFFKSRGFRAVEIIEDAFECPSNSVGYLMVYRAETCNRSTSERESPSTPARREAPLNE